ncbi:carboxyl transferase domain-containing protein [Streptomyces sp. KL116D]|uniref:carboxyl transferase domain-containing protein n=1 Tax=Streptomyces sp. KL116D TaxID=3045152 RepID=UPI003556048F
MDRTPPTSAARFLRLCEAFRLPVLSLCDTPGFMVGPDAERTATVRQFADLFAAGARLTVPLVCLVLRKAYGLGAMAMMGGSTAGTARHGGLAERRVRRHGPGGRAVRLGYRRELAAIADPAERSGRSRRGWPNCTSAARRLNARPPWRSTRSSTRRVPELGAGGARRGRSGVNR